MKPAGQPKQPGCGEYPKKYVMRMLERSFFCNVKDTRAQDFTIAHIVISLSLYHIHLFIHLRQKVSYLITIQRRIS